MVGSRQQLLCLCILGGILSPSTFAQDRVGIESPGTLFARGVNALGAHDYKSAERIFETLRLAGNDSAGVYANLGIAYLHTEHLDLAIQSLTHARSLAPGDLAINLDLGIAYYKAGKFDLAIAPLGVVRSLQPTNLQATYLRGMCHFLLDDFASASRELSMIEDQETRDLEFLLVLGIASGKSGETELSAETFERLVQAGGNTPHLHLLLGKAFIELGDDVKAERELNIAALGSPPLPLVHYYLGLLLKRHLQSQQAASEFREEIKVSPRDPWAYEELGAIQLAQGHAERAVKWIEIARTYNPDSPELMSNLARAYTHLSRPEKALPLLAHAASLEPGNGSLHYQLGRAYESLNRKQEAATEFREAASLMHPHSKAQLAATSSQFAVHGPPLVEPDSLTLGP